MSDAVAIALIGTLGSVVTAILSAIAVVMAARAASKAKEAKEQAVSTHDLVNGKMTELLDATRGQAHAEGVTAGEAAARDRLSDSPMPVEVVAKEPIPVTVQPPK